MGKTVTTELAYFDPGKQLIHMISQEPQVVHQAVLQQRSQFYDTFVGGHKRK